MSANSKNKEEAYNGIKELVEKFKSNYKQFHSSDYNETLTRQDFINPFFEYLGWDISNKQGLSQTYRDVIHEDKLKIGKETKAPDYSFRIGGNRVFFVEAKKPSRNLKEDSDAAYQIRRYAWSGKLAVSILTDFEEFAIYDCSKKPSPNDKASMSRIEYINYEDYLNRFDFLYDTFAKENVLRGSLEKYNADTKSKKGTESVDIDFLNSLDDLRTKLASNISKLNSLSLRDLNFAVQHIIDRIIFLRVAEDRGVENYGDLREACFGNNYYKNIVEIFKKADGKYNSGIFDFSKDKITQNIEVDNKVIKEIINDLYYPKSPYEFSVISVEIIGNAYEQFLGKTITIGNNSKAKIELKPEVRKAGGVYYTPEYIVDYIVENTVGEKIKGKTPKEIANIKIVDPACGSGSFLIGAYKYLLNYHREYYSKQGKKKFLGSKEDAITEDGELALWVKKQILINNIFGVDIDSNAVEVTKLSLLLKCMENETPASIMNNQSLFNERALPSLDENIKCGNSLIGNDFYSGGDSLNIDIETQYKINCFDWEREFSSIFKSGGFDIVIGNPPYVFVKYVEWAEDIKNYFTDNYNISNKNNKSKANQSGKINLYTLFIFKCNQILKENGYFSFIVPNGLLRTTTYDMARKFILDNYHIDFIADLKDGVFKGVTAPTIIFRFSKSKSNNEDTLIIDANYSADGFIDKNKSHYINQSIFLQNTSYAFSIFLNSKETLLFEKMNKNKYILGDITSEIIAGIVCDTKLILNEMQNHKLCKKLLKGKNIKKYKIEFDNNYLIFDRKKLHRGRPDEVWNSDRKIITQRISGGLHPIVAALDTEHYYCFASTNLIIIKDEFKDIYSYELICALLNSKLINFYYVKNFTNASTLTVNISKTFLEKIPLPLIDLNNKEDKEMHDKIVTLVDNIIALNKKLSTEKNPNSITIINRQINAVDKQIDSLVYKLYNLSDEEIRVIEGD